MSDLPDDSSTHLDQTVDSDGSVSATTSRDAEDGASLLARLDRIDGWPYSWLLFVPLGVGFFLAFYDISNIAFSLPGYRAAYHLSLSDATIAISAGLYGYIGGSYLNGLLSQAWGRRLGFVVATLAFSLGSIACTVSFSYDWLIIWRVITGMGIGAEIAVVSTYLGEISPASYRGRTTTFTGLFAMTGAGVTALIAYGVIPTGPDGWRFMFLIGAVGGLTLLLVPSVMPESPRWLVNKGRLDEARAIIGRAERVATQRLGRPLADIHSVEPPEWTGGYLSPLPLLRSRTYVQRTLLLFVLWSVQYLGLYTWLGLGPTLLLERGYTLTAGIAYLAIGAAGYPVGSLLSVVVADRGDRRYRAAGGAMVIAVGFLILASFTGPWSVYVGAFLVQCGAAQFVPLMYTITAENFPTSVRAVGLAYTDGAGHVGGALAPIVATAVFTWGGIMSGFSSTFFMAMLCVVIVAVLVLFTPRATGETLGHVNAARKPASRELAEAQD